MDTARMEILSQEIDEKSGFYRLRTDRRIRYLHIEANVYDEDTMCRPYLLIPALPTMPDGDWVSMHVYCDEAGNPQYEVSFEPLPAMSAAEQRHSVELLSLTVLHKYTIPRVKEVRFDGRPAIAKFACWPWEVPNISNEAQAYQKINDCQTKGEASLVPEVLAYITENGRPIGLLLEKLEGEPPRPDDLAACEAALRRLHEIGLVHGDVNKYNLLIDRESGVVRLVDLEHSAVWKRDVAEAELKSLAEMLDDESGVGQHRPW